MGKRIDSFLGGQMAENLAEIQYYRANLRRRIHGTAGFDGHPCLPIHGESAKHFRQLGLRCPAAERSESHNCVEK
jgi:hypothetical protein